MHSPFRRSHLLALLVSLAGACPAGAQCEVRTIWEPTGSNPSNGRAVAVAFDRALVGYGSNSGGLLSGSVTAERYDGSDWVFESKLVSSDIAGGDFFGDALDMEGNLAAIGAPGADVGGVANAGAVYVFEHDGSNWIERAKFVAPIPEENARFGESVAIADFAVVVGAPFEGPDDTGAAYVFRRFGAAWTFEQELLPAQPLSNGSHFGHAVDATINAAVVSCEQDTSTTGRVDVYQYNLGTGNWFPSQVVQPALLAAGDTFGYDVSMDMARLAISAPGAHPFSGVVGRVFVYEASGGGYVPMQVVTGSTSAADDWYGSAIALEGDTLLTGAVLDDAPGANTGGSMTVHRLVGGTWIEDEVFTPLEQDPSDRFGESVALAGRWGLVGAPWVDGSFSNVGAAYVLSMDCDIDFYGCGVNPDGSLVHLGGHPSVGKSVALGITNTFATQSPGALPVLVVCSAPDPAFPCGSPLPGFNMSGSPAPAELLVGVLPPNPLLYLFGPPWAGFGSPAPIVISVPPIPALAGDELFVQGALVDPSSTFVQIAATRAARLRIGS